MKLFIGLVLWCLLFAVSGPLAIFALVIFPVLWLVSLPFRLVTIVIRAAFRLLAAILFLPARLLGMRP